MCLIVNSRVLVEPPVEGTSPTHPHTQLLGVLTLMTHSCAPGGPHLTQKGPLPSINPTCVLMLTCMCPPPFRSLGHMALELLKLSMRPQLHRSYGSASPSPEPCALTSSWVYLLSAPSTNLCVTLQCRAPKRSDLVFLATGPSEVSFKMCGTDSPLEELLALLLEGTFLVRGQSQKVLLPLAAVAFLRRPVEDQRDNE